MAEISHGRTYSVLHDLGQNISTSSFIHSFFFIFPLFKAEQANNNKSYNTISYATYISEQYIMGGPDLF